MHDLIILGGGPAGYRAAQVAADGGLKTLLIEEKALGGVCLNEGCIPSKTFLHSAKLFDYANGEAEKYGIKCSNASIDQKVVTSRKNRVVTQLVNGVTSSLKNRKVDVVNSFGKILSKNSDSFSIEVNGAVHTASKLLICSGSEPIIPPIKGLEESLKTGFALTSREIFDIDKIPGKVVVLGGGVIGLEMASYFNSVGSNVTVIEMTNRIAGQIDNEISSMLMSIYKNKGIKFLLDTKITSLIKSAIEYKTKDIATSIEADMLFIGTGRKPSINNIGLQNINLLTQNGAIITDSYMKTNVPGVFAAGDVNGKSMLAHTAYREAEVAVNVMLGKKDYMDYSAIPNVIYTNPEVASVGETEESAREKGIDIVVRKLPMGMSGRFLAENEKGRGICKVIFDKDNKKLLGATMLANPSSEIITFVASMIQREERSIGLQKVIYPHPSITEIFKDIAFF